MDSAYNCQVFKDKYMTSNISRISIIAQLTFIILALSFSTLAAGELDTSFPASLTFPVEAGWGKRVLRQPDGKYLVSGFFRAINGITTSNIVRLNPDGKIDLTFKAAEFQNNNIIITIDMALQSNGKILVTGQFTAVGGQPYKTFARLNPDGSLDTTFPQLFPPNSNNGINKIYVFPDDSFLIGGSFTVNSSGGSRSYLARLNADGIVDSSFNYTLTARIYSFDVQPDGKIVAGWVFDDGQSSLPRVNRFNSDGSLDATFAQISTQAFNGISAVKCLPDGKVMVGGNFNLVNNDPSRGQLFRANPDGTIDTTFLDPQLNNGVLVIVPDASGKIYIGGWYSEIGGSGTSIRMHRLNADGTRDTTFSFFNSSSGDISDIFIQPDGKLIVLGNGVEEFISRANSNGSRDTTFPILRNISPGTGLSVLVQPDNKILVGGPFNSANGVIRRSFARFNADGTLDTGFVPPSFGNAPIYDLALQTDGKILVGGNTFGNARRLNSNGASDITFTGTTNYTAIESLPDGKVLIGGATLRRHNSDGSLDTTLATVSGGTSPAIYKIALQPDGKIIINGSFTTVNGTNRGRIARLNADGTVDTSFNPPGGANADVFAVALQADGKMLVGGSFTSFNSDTSKKYLARLNADGSLDTSFSPNLDSTVVALKIQPDGKILLGGSMSAVNGVSRRGIARINANGTLDTTFNVGTGTNGTVWGVAQQSDGKVIYVGEFTVTNGTPTIGIGRLLNVSVTRSVLFDFDGDNKADISVFRASENKWYILQSSNSAMLQVTFAVAGDVPAPADYDGDGKTDVGIFRPSTGDWWYLSSISDAQVNVNWGQSGDIPRPSDFDGDGKTDFVLYRPSNSVWYRLSATGQSSTLAFGIAEDKPLIGDFDGDGKFDAAIFRPSTGDWWYASSVLGGQFAVVHWGQAGDIPVPGDYDADGKTDFVVYRPSNGGWYILRSGEQNYTILQFGIAEDKPVAADYDGDGKADVAVWRPSTGTWYLLQTTSGFGAVQWGTAGDIPTENAFIP